MYRQTADQEHTLPISARTWTIFCGCKGTSSHSPGQRGWFAISRHCSIQIGRGAARMTSFWGFSSSCNGKHMHAQQLTVSHASVKCTGRRMGYKATPKGEIALEVPNMEDPHRRFSFSSAGKQLLPLHLPCKQKGKQGERRLLFRFQCGQFGEAVCARR